MPTQRKTAARHSGAYMRHIHASGAGARVAACGFVAEAIFRKMMTALRTPNSVGMGLKGGVGRKQGFGRLCFLAVCTASASLWVRFLPNAFRAFSQFSRNVAKCRRRKASNSLRFATCCWHSAHKIAQKQALDGSEAGRVVVTSAHAIAETSHGSVHPPHVWACLPNLC